MLKYKADVGLVLRDLSLTNNHSTVDAGSKKWTCYCAWEFRDVLEVWNKGCEVTRSQRPTGEAGRLDYGWPLCQAKVYKLHPEERSGQGWICTSERGSTSGITSGESFMTSLSFSFFMWEEIPTFTRL